jgi:beta-lactamase regulating signal transducer with metallopeptidase domain
LLLTPLLDRKYAAGGRYVLWILVMAGLCVPFVPFRPFPAIQIDVPVAAENPPEYITARDTAVSIEPEIIPSGTSTTGKYASILPALDIPKTILIVWLAGVLLTFAFQILAHRSFSRFAKRWSEPETDPDVIKAFNAECSRMKIRRIINLKRCKGIKAPMMLGFFKPAILLPYSHYDTEELTLILRHELIHYKRRDLWYKLALAVIKSVYWFNPAVYLMAKQANKDIETVCDVLTVSGTNTDLRKRYSETILSMACGDCICLSQLTTRFLGDKNMLKQRFSNIFGTAKKRGTAVFTAMSMVIILSGLFVGFNLAQTSHGGANASVNKGDKISFDGHDWIVLDVVNGKALILSDKIIEKRAYHSLGGNISWENCELRQYLNREFYEVTFSVEEKKRIIKNTMDKVFLLSVEEIGEYFNKDDSGRVSLDASSSMGRGWWLRSPSGISLVAALVHDDDNRRISIIGSNVLYESGGVRPALWLKL